jgi:serine/threonine protein kinase
MMVKILEKSLSDGHDDVNSQNKQNADLQRHIERAQIEVEILQKLDHPNILKIADVYEDKQFFIYVSYYDVKLNSEPTKFPREKVKQIAYTLLSTLNHCHERGVVSSFNAFDLIQRNGNLVMHSFWHEKERKRNYKFKTKHDKAGYKVEENF